MIIALYDWLKLSAFLNSQKRISLDWLDPDGFDNFLPIDLTDIFSSLLLGLVVSIQLDELTSFYLDNSNFLCNYL